MKRTLFLLITLFPLVCLSQSLVPPHRVGIGVGKKKAAVTASAGTGGTISPSGSTVVATNGSQKYTITPSTGYTLCSILVDGVPNLDSTTSYTFNNVRVSHTIVASFYINTNLITATQGPHGTLTPAGITAVNYNSNQQYSFSTSAPFALDTLRVDGTRNTDSTGTYTFPGVTTAHAIYTSFVLSDSSKPVFDAVSGDTNTHGDINSRTWLHTTNGRNRYILVSLCKSGAAAPDSITIKATGSSTTTQLASITATGSTYLWGVKNPPLGLDTIRVYFPFTAYASCVSTSYMAVNQTTPIGAGANATGTSATASVGVASASTNDLVVGGFGTQVAGAVFTPTGTGQVQRWQAAISNGQRIQWSDMPGASGTVTPTSTLASNLWVATGVNLKNLVNADSIVTLATNHPTAYPGSTTATINGTVDNSGATGTTTTIRFIRGTSSASLTDSSGTPSPSTLTGTTPTSVSQSLSSLTANTKYYYEVAAINGGGYVRGALDSVTTAIFADNFEGGYLNGWSDSTSGTGAGTWASMSVTGPSGGGSYGAHVDSSASARYIRTNGYTGSSLKEIYYVFWARVGAVASQRTQLSMITDDAVNPYGQVMFCSTADNNPQKIRMYQGSQFLGSTTVSTSTWYKIKVRTKIATTSTGIIQVWLWTGSAWNLEISQTALNLGTGIFNRAYMGNSSSGQNQKTFFDEFEIYSYDPG